MANLSAGETTDAIEALVRLGWRAQLDADSIVAIRSIFREITSDIEAQATIFDLAVKGYIKQ